MDNFAKRFQIEASPAAPKSQTIVRQNVRLTVLTDCLVRVEVQKDGIFCDEPTQSVWFRDFENPTFTVHDIADTVQIQTSKVTFVYSLSAKKMERIMLPGGKNVTDYKKGNLKGTCRTLDITAIVKLEDGICSRNGVAILDDSDTLVLKSDGCIVPRSAKESDVYFFAYGSDYIGATTALYKLTGRVPLIPRYALSNWWSRYKAYTQEEYLRLMDRFKEEEIPISVATVDMDWHWVDIKSKFGKDCYKPGKHLNFMEYVYDILTGGWTGYSFNTDLFPDPDAFLKKLKDDGYRVTFNIHPSMGVRWFEDCYEDMCRAMGLDPKKKQQIEFDITDPKFTRNYFDVVHRPLEEKGVDFWWIDWQQGKRTKVPGLDPLWALNHYHFMDNAKHGNRPLILSRFCGAGSQRYPLGFSGDTTQTWKSLAFQPGFTATASNIAYPWWSHDIGGHCMGQKDDELYVRWVQLGVFSPIMRLHSTNNDFAGKEPWNYSGPAERIAKNALRLHHKLLPYIYTMSYRTHAYCRALCEPMYYHYPNDENAYKHKNEFFFGSELIAAPITEHTAAKTNMAGVDVWLPAGRYTDIFTDRIYNGNRVIRMYRDLESFPVLAKAGAIIPMSVNDRRNDCSNPAELEILIYRGNNTFEMYEDDGETLAYRDGQYLKTAFTVAEDGSTVHFTAKKSEGTAAVVPQRRTFTFLFKDIVSAACAVTVNGKEINAAVEPRGRGIAVTVKAGAAAQIDVSLTDCAYLANEDKKTLVTRTVSKFQMSTDKKGLLFGAFAQGKAKMPNLSQDFTGPLAEIEAMQ